MKQLTGVDLDYKIEEAQLKVAITGDPKIFDSVKDGFTYGTDMKVGPVFYASKDSGEVVGKLTHNDLPGLVVKRFDNWTSVYSAAPCVPAEILRKLADMAGVNLYTGLGDVVYANKSYLSLTVNDGGKRTIHLPHTSDVYDLFDEKLVGIQIKEFSVDMLEKSTKVWLIENK
jgi:hypothetical protein